jgi:hypothetical protein
MGTVYDVLRSAFSHLLMEYRSQGRFLPSRRGHSSLPISLATSQISLYAYMKKGSSAHGRALFDAECIAHSILDRRLFTSRELAARTWLRPGRREQAH